MKRPAVHVLVLAGCLAGAAPAAHAQLGGLIKKAAGKVVDKKVDEATRAPEKPLEGDPVSAANFDGLLKGLHFELDQQVEAVRLKAVQEQKSEAWSKADDAGRDDAAKYRTANDNVLRCINDTLAGLTAAHSREMPSKIMGMVNGSAGQQTIKAMVDLQQRVADAQTKSDTAAMRRLNGQYMKLLGVDEAADSAQAYKACGTPPAPPASYVLTERRAEELRNANEALRKVEVDLSDRAAAEAGMPPKDYFLARERLWAWNAARKAKTGTGGVTKDEDALFKSRAADIMKVEKALR